MGGGPLSGGKSFRSKAPHAPVNPATGVPGGPAGPEPVGTVAPWAPGGVSGPLTTGCTDSGAAAASSAQADRGCASASPDVPRPSAASTASGTESCSADAASPVHPPIVDDPSLDDLLGRVRSVLDSRIVSTVVLACLLFAIVGLDAFFAMLVLFFAGYVLLDRFLGVRRAITLGGVSWFVVVVAGAFLSGRVGPLWFSTEYVFMFSGFLLAVAVCGVFFAGRAFYYYGFGRGQARADADIARHMVDRLIDRPDEVGNLDGTYLEVEGALNRVRAREQASADALRDEARRKDDLVTYLAHDLKTPLASVVGYLSLLEEAPDLPAEQRCRFTGIALDKAHRLDALIEEFFDITRFDFHDIVLTRGYVDLPLMLAQVADEFYPILTEQGKTAQIDAPAHLTVLIDGDKMARVFNNVMKNAIAYSYEGSTIRVSAASEPEGTVIRFENRGDPIPAPKLSLIFEKFYRLDAARATNRGGAGLGLAIAKEIVTAHGGTITCESTPEHTVFTITLPE